MTGARRRDNFAADRAMAEMFAQAIPTIHTAASEAVTSASVTRYLAGEAGIGNS